MNDQAIVEVILKEQWPSEAALVGGNTLAQVASKSMETSRNVHTPTGGHPFDLAPALQLLAAGAAVTYELIRLYRVLRDRPGAKEPTAKELVEAADPGKMEHLAKKPEIQGRIFDVAEAVLKLVKQLR
jgi:hypothetical protein